MPRDRSARAARGSGGAIGRAGRGWRSCRDANPATRPRRAPRRGIPVAAATRRAASPRATPDATRRSTSARAARERLVGGRGRPDRVGRPARADDERRTRRGAGSSPAAAARPSSPSGARGRPSRGAWSARGRRRRAGPAPQAAARSRSVAATRPGASYTIAARSSAAIARQPLASLAAASAAGTPRTLQRGPATPDATTAASTADAPGIGTTAPPSAAQAAHEVRARVADDRRARRRSRAPGPRRSRRCSQQLRPAGPGRCGRGSWSSASRCSWRCSSRAGEPRVLGGDQRHRAAASRCARRVMSAEVADRRRDDVQGPARLAARPDAGSLTGPTTRPAARVQVVHAGGPRPELGDRRHLALELGAGDHPVDPLDERRLEAELGAPPRSTGACRPARTGAGRASG